VAEWLTDTRSSSSIVSYRIVLISINISINDGMYCMTMFMMEC
jgi:hypothetical protein